MAKFAALAPNPVGFTDSDGNQLFIPASQIYFEDGVVKLASSVTLPRETREEIVSWLAVLARDGILKPDTQALPTPAMVITAKDAGSFGNSVQIAFTNVGPDPANPNTIIFDATVTETDTYLLLTPGTVEAILGKAAGNGQKPGLVYVASAGAPVQPKNGKYAMPGDPAKVDVPKSQGGGAAFRLAAKGGGADGALTEVNIADSDARAGTFTLTAVWKKSASGIQAKDLETAFNYEITVKAPGAPLAAPAAGTYALGGGADARPAAYASATIPAS